MQPGDVAHEVIEPLSADPGGGVHVHAVEALHDLRVVGDGEVGGFRLAEALYLHVAAVVRADGHGGVYHLGDDQHDAVQVGGQLLLHLLELGQTVGIGLDLGLGLLGLRQLARVFLGLPHEHTHLFGQLVAQGAEVAGLLHGGAALGIDGHGLVYQGQLGVLKLLADVFFDGFGVLPKEFDVKHGVAPRYRNNCFT